MEVKQWYCKTRNVEITNIDLIVPKWEPRIGASIDGDVKGTEGIIKIETPSDIYLPIKEHMQKIGNGWKPPRHYHAHVLDSHYAQIQGCLRIMGKKWCDYIVYSTDHRISYIERIEYNDVYWDHILFPNICKFLNNI